MLNMIASKIKKVLYDLILIYQSNYGLDSDLDQLYKMHQSIGDQPNNRKDMTFSHHNNPSNHRLFILAYNAWFTYRKKRKTIIDHINTLISYIDHATVDNQVVECYHKKYVLKYLHQLLKHHLLYAPVEYSRTQYAYYILLSDSQLFMNQVKLSMSVSAYETKSTGIMSSMYWSIRKNHKILFDIYKADIQTSCLMGYGWVAHKRYQLGELFQILNHIINSAKMHIQPSLPSVSQPSYLMEIDSAQIANGIHPTKSKHTFNPFKALHHSSQIHISSDDSTNESSIRSTPSFRS